MTKPVAWMASNELLFSAVKDEIYHIPLYTHPMRELTELRQLQAECIDKDSRILDMQYKIKDLEYQVKMLNDLLQLKKDWRDFDVDGRC
jgi:hypothetical protein